MRKRVIIASIVVALLGVWSYQTVYAATTILSQAQIDAIKNACQASQSNLQRLQQSDRLLRVNLGQNYDSIARSLMAPLNSRMAINGLNGVDLATTTVDFDTAFAKFRSDYTAYDDSLQKAIAVNCTTNPVDQYRAIEDARQARQTVFDDTKTMQGLLKNYKNQIKEFEKSQLGDGA